MLLGSEGPQSHAEKSMRSMTTTTNGATDWRDQIYDIFRENGVRHVAHVPDGGHAKLIKRCEADPEMTTVTLTTEEEGVGMLIGSWLGGTRGALLIQSSGVGNCMNALSVLKHGKFPILMIVSMRGTWGEGMPWQVPMGQATRAVLEDMGVIVYDVANAADVQPTIEAATWLAFDSSVPVAVLLQQRLIGTKKFVAA
jgi:sulfopyruvate decarboxylase alpha subunit